MKHKIHFEMSRVIYELREYAEWIDFEKDIRSERKETSNNLYLDINI